ncbi:MAG: hypothetical protein ACE5MM_11360 [Nitrospiraceae bacterium]
MFTVAISWPLSRPINRQVGAGKTWRALDLNMALAEAGVLLQEITLRSVMLDFVHAFEEIQAAGDVISFECPDGQITGLLGPNGAG